MKTQKRQDKRQNIKQIIKQVSSRGKIFSVRFIKANGQKRKMACRFGVKKHLKGGKSTTAHIEDLITVFSMNDDGYRCANTETIYEIRGCRKVFKF